MEKRGFPEKVFRVFRGCYWGYPWAFAGPEGGELPFVLNAGPRGMVARGGTAVLWAQLMEGPLPQRVMVTIVPPTVAYTPGKPVTNLPTLTLSRQRQGQTWTWRWSAPTTIFAQPGAYTILYQALYANNRLSAPVQTRVSVGTATRHWRLY